MNFVINFPPKYKQFRHKNKNKAFFRETLVKMPPRKSKYSEFFEFNGQNATCKTCGETIKRTSGSTSGLKYHLEEIHGKKSQSDEVENAGPAPKKAKSDDDGQKVMDDFYKVTGKEPLEDLVAREACNGATYSYIGKSYLIKKGLNSLGYKAPNHHYSVKRLVHKSAENHREKLREKLKKLKGDHQRFCVITDEWTCTNKRRKYINVTLHLKGKFLEMWKH